MRAKSRKGKGGKKDWWVEVAVPEECQVTKIATLGAKLAVEIIESRLIGLETRLAMADLAYDNSASRQALVRFKVPRVLYIFIKLPLCIQFLLSYEIHFHFNFLNGMKKIFPLLNFIGTKL